MLFLRVGHMYPERFPHIFTPAVILRMGGACSQAVVEAGAFSAIFFARRRGRFAHDQMKLDLLMQNRSVIGQHFDQVPACTGPDFICWHVDGLSGLVADAGSIRDHQNQPLDKSCGTEVPSRMAAINTP